VLVLKDGQVAKDTLGMAVGMTRGAHGVLAGSS
jgi:hypothetical protein